MKYRCPQCGAVGKVEERWVPSAPDDEFNLVNHVVCFLDLVGQQTKLGGWERLPESNPTPDFIKALKQTVGTVMAFREMFQLYFDEAAKSIVPFGIVDSFPWQERQLIQRAQDCRLKTQQFGDTFVFYSPIPNSDGDVSMGAPFQLLFASCWAMVMSLAGKVPFRGAVSVGTGVELAENVFYGPALWDAYRHEREVAGYPRVVISPEAMRFFKGNAGFSESPPIDRYMKQMAVVCRSMLCMDTDGQLILDFLGRGVLDIVGAPRPDLTEAIEKAYSFVRSESQRFRACDENLALRYAWLQKYMEARLHLWGLQHLAKK